MADAAVEFLLDNIKDLLVYHSNLITETRSQIESLEKDLRPLKSFLKDFKRRKGKRTEALLRSIRDLIYEVEDIIDVFLTQAAEKRAKNHFWRGFSSAASLHGIGKKVEAMTEMINRSRIDFALADEAKFENFEGSPVIREKNVVGFEDDKSKVIGYLLEENNKLDVITVVGMPGIGKTTLAWKIFSDPRIEYEFPIRIWVYISNEFTTRDVYLNILQNFTLDVQYECSDEELSKLVFSHLQTEKFLLVLDDVWSASDWDSLGFALPASNSMGKVLITTCNEEVGGGRRAKIRKRISHKVRFLSETDGWELLQYEVFGETNKCPPELETTGMLIARQCDGLPRAIVAVADSLSRQTGSSSLDIKEKRAVWIQACQNAPKYREKKFYKNLPSHLQVCFLYLAAFPYGFEIPVEELIHMWVAEGFILQEDGLTLEETAQTYLETLIDRNLVGVSKIKGNGRAKTCTIHRMLHDLCKTEAGSLKENILTEIDFSTQRDSEHPISEVSRCRRLSIHSNVSDFLSSKPVCTLTRSFLTFSKEKTELPTEYISAIPETFKLVRVLNVKPIIFTKISRHMFGLVHLRYLALSLDVAIPQSLSKLWNMQTLIVDTTSSRVLEVKADILEFAHLRHFKMKGAAANLRKHNKSGKGGENLISLETISPECCTNELFDRAPNLRKLGIRGRVSLLLDNIIGSLASLAELRRLENLKLLNDVYPRPRSEGRLSGIPQVYQFPPCLRSLTLAATFLDWSHMSTLGLLLQLEVLKLKDNAFVGRIWETEDGGFCRLEALHIEKTDLVIWVTSARHFPRLRRLRLHHCEELQEVPIALADITTLQLLDLNQTKLASASAIRLCKEMLEERGRDAKEFKLSVYP